MPSILRVVAKPALCFCFLLLCAQAASARVVTNYSFYGGTDPHRPKEYLDPEAWFPRFPGTTITPEMRVTIAGYCRISQDFTITIQTGGTFIVGGGLTFGTIVNNGTLLNYGIISATNLTNNYNFDNRGRLAPSTLTNFGTVTNYRTWEITATTHNKRFGSIKNRGTINLSGAYFENHGAFDNESVGVLNLSSPSLFFYSRLDNKGRLHLAAGSTLENNGFVMNHTGGVFQNDGSLVNKGTLWNDGTLNNSGTLNHRGTTLVNGGQLNNTNTLNVAAPLWNHATIDNPGLIFNTSTLTNTRTLNNSGTLDHRGSKFDNTGKLNNTGTLYVYGSLDNKKGAALDNANALFNSGTLSSAGTLNNLLGANLINQTGSQLIISGSMASSGFVSVSQGASFLISGGGALHLIRGGAPLNVTGALTVTGGGLNNGSNLFIFPGGILTAQSSGTLNNQSGATLDSTGGTLTIRSSSTLNSDGALKNNGGAINIENSTLNNRRGAALTNVGSISITLSGALNNQAGATLTNGGTLTNGNGGTLANDGTLTNHNTLTNNGTLTNGNVLDNRHTLINNSSMTSRGRLKLTGGSLQNNNSLNVGGGGSSIERTAGVLTKAPTFSGVFDLVYGDGSTTPGSAIETGPELPASTTALRNLEIKHRAGVTLKAPATVNGKLSLERGNVTTGVHILSLAPAASVNRPPVPPNGHVIGNLRKTYAAAGNKTFEVGTANGYSPVGVNVTAGTFPATITVKATQGKAPYVSDTNALQRYWTLAGTGVTASLTFTYLTTDVVGTAANYKFVKNSGGVLTTLAPASNPSTTSARIEGVTSFSDWTLAERSSLQFPAATYSDGETDADHTFHIPVRRTAGSAGPVSVTYTLTDGTATTADGDYSISPASGTLTWAAGDATDKSIPVTIKGDTKYENNETINLALSSPTNGAVLGRSSATLIVTNNDPAPALSVDDVTRSEGDGGTTAYVFTVTKTGSTALTATVNFQTADGTATAAGGDYQPATGALTFLPTETAKTVTVLVNGDLAHETDETFTLRISGANRAAIADADGLGRIVNDDEDATPPPATLVVNTTDDLDDGQCSAAHCSLREAVAAANLLPDTNTITFAPAVGGVINLTGALPTLSTNMQLSGPGANVLTIARESGGDYRVLTVAADRTVGISGLTVAGGSAPDSGGGISNHGTLTLDAVAVSDNQAAAAGGGIYNAGTLTLTNSTVDGNSAQDGGGIATDGPALITNSTVSGNSAARDGGGLRAGGGPVTLANVTVTDNRADNNLDSLGAGGGLSQVAGAVRLINTLVALNFRGFGDAEARDDVRGAIESLTSFNNLIGDGTGMTGLVDGHNGNQVGTSAAPLSPALGPLDDNGGPTRTHAILDGEFIYNAGSDCVLQSGDGSCLPAPLTTDQRGQPRRDCLRVDIGAVESIIPCA